MNYDIHTGAVLGIWGKILVFVAGIVAACLPLTGFIVWLKKYRFRKRVRKNNVFPPKI